MRRMFVGVVLAMAFPAAWAGGSFWQAYQCDDQSALWVQPLKQGAQLLVQAGRGKAQRFARERASSTNYVLGKSRIELADNSLSWQQGTQQRSCQLQPGISWRAEDLGLALALPLDWPSGRLSQGMITGEAAEVVAPYASHFIQFNLLPEGGGQPQWLLQLVAFPAPVWLAMDAQQQQDAGDKLGETASHIWLLRTPVASTTDQQLPAERTLAQWRAAFSALEAN